MFRLNWENAGSYNSSRGFLLYSGLQSPEFWISEKKYPGFRIPQKVPRFRDRDSITWGEFVLLT